MASYTGQLLAPAEAKKGPIMMFWPILGHFWFSVVALIIFSSKLIKFEERKKLKISKSSKESQKFIEIQKKKI